MTELLVNQSVCVCVCARTELSEQAVIQADIRLTRLTGVLNH